MLEAGLIPSSEGKACWVPSFLEIPIWWEFSSWNIEMGLPRSQAPPPLPACRQNQPGRIPRCGIQRDGDKRRAEVPA